MYCPRCGTYSDQPPKFCKSCGLMLAEHVSLLEKPEGAGARNEKLIRREKQQLNGVMLILLSLINLLIISIIFGIDELKKIPGYSRLGMFLVIANLATPLITGGLGAFNLLRSGFFRNLKERQLRLQLALIEQKRKALETNAEEMPPEVEYDSRQAEATSIAENTTRKLQEMPATTPATNDIK